MTLKMKTREHNRNNKRTKIERFDWCIECSGGKSFMLENFLEINPYFAVTSYCNTIGQANNAFSILGFSLAGKRRSHVLIFHPLADKTKNEHLPNPVFKVIRKSLYRGCKHSTTHFLSDIIKRLCTP